MMTRWTLIGLLLTLATPALAQDIYGLSKAGIPFSPTHPGSYSTVQYGPPGGYDYNTNYYGYGFQGGNYNYGGYGYGFYGDYGSYENPIVGGSSPSFTPGFSSGRTGRTSGRTWPSAAQESRLHEIRR